MKVLFLCLLLPSIGCASLSKLDVSEAVVALEALKVKEATTSYDPFVVIKHLESKKVVQFRKNGGVIYISFPIAYANSTELPDGVGLTHYTDQPMQSKPDFINGEERKSIYYGKEALIGKLLVSFGMKKNASILSVIMKVSHSLGSINAKRYLIFRKKCMAILSVLHFILFFAWLMVIYQ